MAGFSACSKKPELKTSISNLEKAFPNASRGPVALSQPNPTPVGFASSETDTYIGVALAAARAKDYAAAVMALEQVQRMTGAKAATATQLMSIEQAKQAMVGELVSRADRGDAKAKADLGMLEKMHSQ